MPRKQRIEYPGAVYHVISRGNYRKELFLQASTGEAFERCLFETVDRCGWKLHAYVIMSNHYHLAVETPEPNLVAGMKWLQSAFATRFNRLRHECGPVFQGRYKAILIGENRPLLIHPPESGSGGDWFLVGLERLRIVELPKVFPAQGAGRALPQGLFVDSG